MEKITVNAPFDEKSFVINADPRDNSVLGMVKNGNGYYEPHLMNTLKRFLKPDSVCIDIGANIGIIAMAMGYLANEGEVYLFEPSPINFSLLEQTILDNDMPHVKAINLGLYKENTTIEFCERLDGGGWSHLVNEHSPNAANQTVSCVKLDDWVQSNHLPKVDLIKMDIEGMEYEALEGASWTINHFKPNLIIEFNPGVIVGLHQKNPEDLLLLLQSLYSNIYYIGFHDSRLIEIKDYTTLLQHVHSYAGWGDLYCTFEPVE